MKCIHIFLVLGIVIFAFLIIRKCTSCVTKNETNEVYISVIKKKSNVRLHTNYVYGFEKPMLNVEKGKHDSNSESEQDDFELIDKMIDEYVMGDDFNFSLDFGKCVRNSTWMKLREDSVLVMIDMASNVGIKCLPGLAHMKDSLDSKNCGIGFLNRNLIGSSLDSAINEVISNVGMSSIETKDDLGNLIFETSQKLHDKEMLESLFMELNFLGDKVSSEVGLRILDSKNLDAVNVLNSNLSNIYMPFDYEVETKEDLKRFWKDSSTNDSGWGDDLFKD